MTNGYPHELRIDVLFRPGIEFMAMLELHMDDEAKLDYLFETTKSYMQKLEEVLPENTTVCRPYLEDLTRSDGSYELGFTIPIAIFTANIFEFIQSTRKVENAVKKVFSILKCEAYETYYIEPAKPVKLDDKALSKHARAYLQAKKKPSN